MLRKMLFQGLLAAVIIAGGAAAYQASAQGLGNAFSHAFTQEHDDD
ncbi:MAG: hypothetical protein ACM31L_09085 [Actinomycetota bacterium]